jgi:hypothetical protein
MYEWRSIFFKNAWGNQSNLNATLLLSSTNCNNFLDSQARHDQLEVDLAC